MVPFHNSLKGFWHPAFRHKLGCGKSHLHCQLSPLLINLPARILPVDLFVKGPEHGATLPSHLFLKTLMQTGRQMTDASIPGSHGPCPTIKDAKDQHSRGQGPAHASGRSPFHPFFICLDCSPPSVKTGGHLRRIGVNLQFKDLCDRSEDGFASMVSLLTVRIGQLACPFRKGCDSPGLDLIFR